MVKTESRTHRHATHIQVPVRYFWTKTPPDFQVSHRSTYRHPDILQTTQC